MPGAPVGLRHRRWRKLPHPPWSFIPGREWTFRPPGTTMAVVAARETMRRREFIAAFGGMALASPPAARAQGYPNKLIKIILPYTAGSPNDLIARFIAPYLSLRLKQAVIIENRAGGGTSIGVKAVMTAEPDGYTLLFSNSPTHVVASLGHAAFSYDP